MGQNNELGPRERTQSVVSGRTANQIEVLEGVEQGWRREGELT
jgi:hypothetical protein